MSKNNLLTHILNEDIESYNKDSMDFLNEGEWGDRLKSVVNTKTLGKILSPRKKGNILDDLVNMASDKIDQTIGKVIDYITANGIERTIMNFQKNLVKLEKQKQNVANKILKQNGGNVKALSSNQELMGIVDQIVVIKTNINMLQPYVNSSENSKTISTGIEDNLKKSSKKADFENKKNALLKEILELELDVLGSVPPNKQNYERRLQMKYLEYNRLLGIAGSGAKSGAVTNAGGAGGAN